MFLRTKEKHMSRYNQDQLPQSLYVKVVHLHVGNSSNNQRRGHEMVTVAEIKSKFTNETIAKGKAHCSKRDSPRRQIGRQVAVGRAIKAYWDEFNDIEQENAA